MQTSRCSLFAASAVLHEVCQGDLALQAAVNQPPRSSGHRLRNDISPNFRRAPRSLRGLAPEAGTLHLATRAASETQALRNPQVGFAVTAWGFKDLNGAGPNICSKL